MFAWILIETHPLPKCGKIDGSGDRARRGEHTSNLCEPRKLTRCSIMTFRLNRSIRSQKSPAKTRPFQWSDGSSSHPRRAYGTAKLPIFRAVDLYTPSGSYTQDSRHSPTREADSSPTRDMSFRPSLPPVPKRDHRRVQWERWTKEVIPRLVPVFMALVRESNHFAKVAPQNWSCGCPPSARTLKVVVVSFSGVFARLYRLQPGLLTKTGVRKGEVCTCKPTVLLLQNGLFPSAPVRPTFAFDVHMLEFVRELHLRSPPNKTAWSATLEAFFYKQGFKVSGKDIYRRKLASCLRWYTFLRVAVEVRVRKAVADTLWNDRALNLEEIEIESGEEDGWEDVKEDGLDYLVRCCPACFASGMVPGATRYAAVSFA